MPLFEPSLPDIEVGFNVAGTSSYTVPDGYSLRFSRIRPGAGGGGGGGSGGKGGASNTGGGGGGSGGGKGAPVYLQEFPTVASAGDVLSIVVGDGGLGGSGSNGLAVSSAQDGQGGGPTSVTNTTTGQLLAQIVGLRVTTFTTGSSMGARGGNGNAGTSTGGLAAATTDISTFSLSPMPGYPNQTIATVLVAASPGGQGGGASTSGSSTILPAGAIRPPLPWGPTVVTALPTTSSGGAASSTRGGGGAGGYGDSAYPGDEVVSVLTGSMPPTSGPGSGRGGLGGNGSAGNNAGSSLTGSAGTDGSSGSGGRGGGGGGGGGGSGASNTTTGPGGNGGNGAKGSDGAVILYLKPV